MHVSKCIFCLIDNKCILSVTVFVYHDKRNVSIVCFLQLIHQYCLLETINSPVLFAGNKYHLIPITFVVTERHTKYLEISVSSHRNEWQCNGMG